MIRGLALLALVAVAFCDPVKFFDVVAPYHRDLDPEVVDTVRQGLDSDDVAAIRAVAANYDKYNDDDEAMLALKEENDATYEKIMVLHNLLKNKIEALGDEGEALAKKVVAELHRIFAVYVTTKGLSLEEKRDRLNLETLKAQAAEFEALSPSDKAEFKEEFPFISSVLESRYRTLATEFLENSN